MYYYPELKFLLDNKNLLINIGVKYRCFLRILVTLATEHYINTETFVRTLAPPYTRSGIWEGLRGTPCDDGLLIDMSDAVIQLLCNVVQAQPDTEIRQTILDKIIKTLPEDRNLVKLLRAHHTSFLQE